MKKRVIALFSACAFILMPWAASYAASTENSANTSITVGSADFPESQLLATIYAKALSAKGITVKTRMSIGSREVYMPALLDGSIDLLPEYSGAALSYLQKNPSAHSPDEVAAGLKAALPKGITMLTPSQAQDADAVVVTRATADKYQLKTLADLAPVADKIVLGGSPEWKTRTEGLLGLEKVYGLKFKDYKALGIGPITLTALLNGRIQAAELTSTDPAIASKDLVVLDDVKSLFMSQNIVPIIAESKVSDTVSQTLNAVSAALTTADLTRMNERLANYDSFDVVASDWLKAHKLM
ncbi:ABC transporter substrate-binding protein [Pantoea cypripedii]|uniref:ABC transporter substrate-binding protein n=1 Tax=Pantoea cypripedii TaxID=55209 RepID=UPI002FC8DC89